MIPTPRWPYLAVPLFVLCACVPPQPYENIFHLNYGARLNTVRTLRSAGTGA